MTTRDDLRRAGYSAFLAVPALALSGVFLALFFGGAGDFYGYLNDFFVALAMALLILPAVALLKVVKTTGGRWFTGVTWLCVGGLLLATAGQLLLVARVISLEGSFVTGTLGILPVLVWAGAQAYLGIRHGKPSRSIGFAVGMTLTLAAGLTAAWSADLDLVVWLLSAALAAAIVAYLFLLGKRLLDYSREIASDIDSHVPLTPAAR